MGIVIVATASGGCGVYVSLVLVRTPSPLSDAWSAPIWTPVFSLIVAVLLGIAGGIVTSVRCSSGRSPVAGAIATVPASLATIATVGFTISKGDNDGLWTLIYPAALVWAVVLFGLSAVASLLARPLTGAWSATVFAACLGLTLVATTPGLLEADRTASTSWVTLRGGSNLTRSDAAELLVEAQRHAATIDNDQPECGFQMTGTQALGIVCGPTSAPLYPYAYTFGRDMSEEPAVLMYGIERVDGTWRALPPPAEEEVPPGEPPLTDGPYATTALLGPVLDLDGNHVDFDR